MQKICFKKNWTENSRKPNVVAELKLKFCLEKSVRANATGQHEEKKCLVEASAAQGGDSSFSDQTFTEVLDSFARACVICLGLDKKSHYFLELCLCDQNRCDKNQYIVSKFSSQISLFSSKIQQRSGSGLEYEFQFGCKTLNMTHTWDRWRDRAPYTPVLHKPL